MDFLNKLSAKAGETFQTIKESDATKKAKNYAEIPGLSLQVGKQESIVKKAYQEIGEAYYLAHKDDVDSIYSEQMQTITKALAKIEELKTEIENKKKDPVSYTHLRAHETRHDLVCRLLLEKIFFNDTATTEIYTLSVVGSVRCV